MTAASLAARWQPDRYWPTERRTTLRQKSAGPLGELWHDGDVVKQVRTPPVRPADGVVGCVYESFVLGEDCRGLGLRAKIKSAEHTPAL